MTPLSPSSSLPLWKRLLGKVRQAASPRADAQALASLMNDRNAQRYMDPAIIARLGATPLLARLVVEGFINGLHKSPFHGFSVEFADHRQYVPGDDLKYIDWALFGRTDHYYIKRFEEETNLRCYLLLDRSASMGFGTGQITKWDYACFLSTCLAYLMLKQQDAAGLSLFGDRPGMMIPPRCRSVHLRQMMKLMIDHPPAGKTHITDSLRAIVRNLKRRGLVVIVSDLIDDQEATLKAIRLIRSHAHDVIVFHIQDAAELDFNFDGATLFQDMETGQELEIDPAVVREHYLKQLAQQNDFYRKGLTEMGIDYQPISTRQPYDLALGAYLKRRTRIRK